MHRKYSMHSGEALRFVCHNPTQQIGVVVEAETVEEKERLTVRLAGGNLMSASAEEFRDATEGEIAKRHEVAALTRPLPLPEVPATYLPGAPQVPHRPTL